MKVHELIQQLQDCDQPDADVILVIRSAYNDVRMQADTVTDVYYDSVIDNSIIIDGR